MDWWVYIWLVMKNRVFIKWVIRWLYIIMKFLDEIILLIYRLKFKHYFFFNFKFSLFWSLQRYQIILWGLRPAMITFKNLLIYTVHVMAYFLKIDCSFLLYYICVLLNSTHLRIHILCFNNTWIWYCFLKRNAHLVKVSVFEVLVNFSILLN